MPGRFAPWLQTLTKEFNFPLWPSPLWYLSSPPLLLCFSSIVNGVIFFIHCCPRHRCCARVLQEWAKSYIYINYLQTARLSPPLNHKVPVLQKETTDWGSEDCCWVEENNLLMPEQPESLLPLKTCTVALYGYNSKTYRSPGSETEDSKTHRHALI